MSRRQWLLWFEFVLLFVGLPVLLSFLPMRSTLFGTLWVMAIGCAFVWRRQTKKRLRDLIDWRGIPADVWASVLMRFAVCAAAMAIFTMLHDPQRLLSLPTERPAIWGLVMLFYPVLSVVPQEMIYRVFFFHRYASLFATDRAMMVASGLAFGHAHFMFGNWVAYSMSMVGGLLFAHSYVRCRSFALVWAEHALYGCFVFTIGLGWYFYSGAQLAR